jgi:hypothetical protein
MFLSPEETHKLLDDLTWGEVQFLADEDASIRRHLDHCQDCRKRETAVIDGQLASLGARQRSRNLEIAEQLANFFTSGTRRPC